MRIRPSTRQNIEGFRDWVTGLPETVGVFVVTGGEDLLVHVAVADNDRLYSFVIDKFTERPEIAEVRTSVIYQHFRTKIITPDPGVSR